MAQLHPFKPDAGKQRFELYIEDTSSNYRRKHGYGRYDGRGRDGRWRHSTRPVFERKTRTVTVHQARVPLLCTHARHDAHHTPARTTHKQQGAAATVLRTLLPSLLRFLCGIPTMSTRAHTSIPIEEKFDGEKSRRSFTTCVACAKFTALSLRRADRPSRRGI